jgi:hypothetical protein
MMMMMIQQYTRERERKKRKNVPIDPPADKESRDAANRRLADDVSSKRGRTTYLSLSSPTKE